MDRTKDSCYIDGKEYSLLDVEKMGLKNFQFSAHIHPYHSIFRYYPNTKKYVKEEKKYRNFSLEALKNNTIYLQDAKNFDDCFDCAVDLEWDKFLFERVKTYCTYFKANSASDNIGDMVYALALKLFEFDTAENGKVFAQIKIGILGMLPIPSVSKSEQQFFVDIVNQINANRNDNASLLILSKEVDDKIYELYGLTQEEIALVEESVK